MRAIKHLEKKLCMIEKNQENIMKRLQEKSSYSDTSDPVPETELETVPETDTKETDLVPVLPSSDSVEPLSIDGINKINAMPSAAIFKENLIPVAKVLSKHSKLRNSLKHVGKLTVILSREAILAQPL